MVEVELMSCVLFYVAKTVLATKIQLFQYKFETDVEKIYNMAIEPKSKNDFKTETQPAKSKEKQNDPGSFFTNLFGFMNK